MTTGTLFTEDFLAEGIVVSPAWAAIPEADIAALRARLAAIFAAVRNPERLNEAQVEERIVRPVLAELGWSGALDVQTNMDRRGRTNVADMTFFPDVASFAKADATHVHDAKLRFAVAVGDAKKWTVDLDGRGGGARAGENPVAQLLRYLARAEVASDRKVRFAILTNGRRWRLYFSGARSLLDGFYEVDLAWLLGVAGAQGELTPAARSIKSEDDATRRDRLLKTFALVFRREAFSPDPALGGATFHDHAINEGRLWEAKVRANLSDTVFNDVFPDLVRALAAADPQAPRALDAAYLATVRDAALALLYRLLFALYAEDRDLLPTRDEGYADYSLSMLRDETARRIDEADRFSERATRAWDHCAGLFRLIDEGDRAIGVPPYNGGLFARSRAAILERARLPDAAFLPLIDKLSRTMKDGRLVRINFRDLSVRELGAIYERLLEREPVADAAAPGGVAVRPNAFSRKNSGSYYTPDELVALIVERAVGPLVEEKVSAFNSEADTLTTETGDVSERMARLAKLDPAQEILTLRVCDPAMGSGHFLVNLIDHLALRVFTAMDEAEASIDFGAYRSPLRARLHDIRSRIEKEAAANGWSIKREHLSDQNLIRRMVLKRCVYGVDKNPMAVELAKVALWLHTFTAGAPLSFLDHHLRCGDSLFGEKVRIALDDLASRGFFNLSDPLKKAEAAFAAMEKIEGLTDAAIAEVEASRDAFADVEARTTPVKNFLDVWQAAKWLLLDKQRDKSLVADRALFDAITAGSFGEAFDVLSGAVEPRAGVRQGVGATAGVSQATGLISRLRAFASEERFLHWEVAFPGVWRNWQSVEPSGGFDAVIGNPPWDRMKMQEVEWFAARAPNIAKQTRAADRKAAVAKLRKARDPLAALYDFASARAESAMERARRSGDYPLLSKGDINLYSLFVERGQSLIHAKGIVGLLTPSGIASDLTASAFFKSVASNGRLLCLFDFENRRGEGSDGRRRGEFFPDVDSRFKFCAFVAGGSARTTNAAECGFFLCDPPAHVDAEQLFRLTAKDFALVNPNTGTAPVFRNKRDADLTTGIYHRIPVLVDRSSGVERKAWPVKYYTMFHMTIDSELFWSRERLEAFGAYPAEQGRWRKGDAVWVPLYVGRMIHQYNHRAASVEVNDDNLHNAATSEGTLSALLSDPDFSPQPQFWVSRSDVDWPAGATVQVAFRDIARVTDMRTMIAALIPFSGVGNKLPLLQMTDAEANCLLLANMNSFVFDFVVRNKSQSANLNLYIVEQLPFVPRESYARVFGLTPASALIQRHVLRLSYTATNLEAFARQLNYSGKPFVWSEQERRQLTARLDALYFHLYGIIDEADIRYILSRFPIVERNDRAAFDGVYLTAELIVWHFRALAAGDATSDAPEAELLRLAKRRTV